MNKQLLSTKLSWVYDLLGDCGKLYDNLPDEERDNFVTKEDFYEIQDLISNLEEKLCGDL